ncbi:MAG: hypothetical protein ABI585_05955 [Betaproteobacteria bacterium]
MRWHVALASFMACVGVEGAAQTVVHGSADAYASPGVAMAWSIARGADEASTAIVVRVVADPARYAWLAVRGVDPFTQQQQAIAAPQAIGGTRDVRIPRARFADTPRTEWQFYPSESAARAGAATLVVYYLGVPDTTPEFADATKAQAYLADRIVRARANPEGAPR